MSPPQRRRAAKHLVGKGICSVRMACQAAGASKSTYYFRPKEDGFRRRLVKRLGELSAKHPRYGYRRITALLRREGWRVNKKRIQKLMRLEGLKVAGPARRRRRLGLSTAQRRRATHSNCVWSWDILHDSLEDGRQLRFLIIVDEYTRVCLKIRVGRHISSADVIEELMGLMRESGAPEHIRSDNGPEFTARAVERWLEFNRIGTIYIEPGSPWENPYIESFNGKFRDECLNRELFTSLIEAQVVVQGWLKEYNEKRPHSALGYMTPAEYANTCSSFTTASLPASLTVSGTGSY